MSFIKNLLTGFLISAASSVIHAETCSCLWEGSFINIADKADLIISGEITQQKGNSIDLQIQKVLVDKANNGKEFNNNIRVWADNGTLCRPDAKQFAIHSRWVMALHKITKVEPGGFNPNTPNISFGRVNDYSLSKCGAYWLQVHDGYVTGNLIKGRRWEWTNNKMNPVLLELVEAYINGVIPEQALIEAAKPQTEVKKLMESTKVFLDRQ